MEQSSFDPRLEAVPAQWLEALAVRVKLHRLEWRVLAIVLSSPVPVTAPSLAKRFHLDYGLVKRVVRPGPPRPPHMARLVGWYWARRGGHGPSGLPPAIHSVRWL